MLRGVDGGRPRDVFREVLAPAAGLDPVAKALYFEAKTFLHGLLVVEDRVSMAHSLEVRVPFLDNELVDVARRIPSHLKHSRRRRQAHPPTRDARRCCRPRSSTSRSRASARPTSRGTAGPTMDYIRELLLDPRTLERGYFRPDVDRGACSTSTRRAGGTTGC